MPLPPPAPRRALHDRDVFYRGFRRDDGLWDIEGELIDRKSHPFEVSGERVWAADEPLHHMRLRATICSEMVVREIAVAMEAHPFGICPEAIANMQRIVGTKMGRGWRRAIEQHLGQEQGCTHLRELLYNLATAAFQTLVEARADRSDEQVPHFIGGCSAWRLSGPVVEREFPLLYRPAAK